MLRWLRWSSVDFFGRVWRRRKMALVSGRLSEQELRELSREQLLEYVLRYESPSPCLRAPVSSSVPDRAPTGAAEAEAVQEKLNSVAMKMSADTVIFENPCASPPKKRRRSVQRDFDMSKYGQRMIAIKFAYLGWHFHGLASQPHSEASVEDHLFSSLLRSKLIISRSDCDYSRAGRTDVGVSALGQVAGLRVRSNTVSPSSGDTELDYVKILNSGLPPQIRVLAWAPVSDGTANVTANSKDPRICDPVTASASDYVESCPVRRPGAKFSARFDAIHRSYKYFFARGDLDIKRMREACTFFVGQHDFRNFCKMDVEKVTNFERVIYDVEIRCLKDDDPLSDPQRDDGEFSMYYVFVRGQAFLWHQIRCMAAVLFLVGRGHESASVVREMLDDPKTGKGPFSNGKPSYQMAPAAPLLLYDCAYPSSVVSFAADAGKAKQVDQTSFFFADAEFASQFGELAAHTAVARSILMWNDSMPIGGLRDDSTPGSALPDSGQATFGALRQKRYLVPRSDGQLRTSSKHIPLAERMKETSLDEKQRRLALKRAKVPL